MPRLAPKTIQPAPLSEAQVIARLNDWRERLAELKAGTNTCLLTGDEIRREIDRLLDQLSNHIFERHIT